MCIQSIGKKRLLTRLYIFANSVDMNSVILQENSKQSAVMSRTVRLYVEFINVTDLFAFLTKSKVEVWQDSTLSSATCKQFMIPKRLYSVTLGG